MSKYHVRGQAKIIMSVDRVIEVNSEIHPLEKMDSILKILVGDPQAFCTFSDIEFDEIKYVNDKGKE